MATATMKAAEKAQHTPGPWEPIGPYAGGGWNVSPGEGRETIHVPYDGGSAEANARLIAAAPDMLSVLRTIVFQTCQGNELDDACITQARAALAKATT